MSALFDRYLPRSERRTALWLALGGAAVTWAASEFGSAVAERLPVNALENPMPQGVAVAVQALAEFALVAVLVAVLIRLARAPKALALYVVLARAVAAAGVLLNVPAGTVSRARLVADMGTGGFVPSTWGPVIGSVSVSLAVALGALAGAWIADTVTLARIRDAGFSGDDPDASDGLRRKPGARGWEFLGWEGRPVGGDALVALAFAAAILVVQLSTVIAVGATALIPGRFEGGIAATAAGVLWAAAYVAAWYGAARQVAARTTLASTWLLPSTALLGTVTFSVEVALSSPRVLGDVASVVAYTLLPQVAAVVAALLGTASARRAKPATLSAPDPQDPGATPPADTAGGI